MRAGRRGRGADDVLAVIARRGVASLMRHLPPGVIIAPGKGRRYVMTVGTRQVATMSPGDHGGTEITVPGWANGIREKILRTLDIVVEKAQDGPLPDRLMNAALRQGRRG